MGILRADRIAGLGGANAITGSVFFGNGSLGTAHDHIVTEPSSDFTMGTGDFTLEGWFFVSSVATSWQSLIGDTLYGSTGGFTFYVNTNQLNFWKGGSSVVSGGTLKANTWHHLAYSRASGSNRIFVDGVLAATASDSTDYTDNELSIGANNVDKGGVIGAYGLNGFASNVRVTKGTALYTATFTPPTLLEQRSDTVLLCCQSCGNIQQEATGKKITGKGNAAASHFTPNSPVGFSTTTDVGSQYGSTFDGFGNFVTSTYMVTPGGNTRERNRGRAIFAGGARSPHLDIQTLDIASGGIAQDFGDLTNTAQLPGSASSTTRMLVASGYIAPGSSNVIEFITIADIASSTDFGDLTEVRRRPQGLSNSTRAAFVGGQTPTAVNTIDYVTIATAGNAADFGDTNAAHAAHGAAVASSTRGVYTIGGVPAYTNTIEFITIATTGNGQDFGDLTVDANRGYQDRGSICDTTRGIFSGGFTGSNVLSDTIEFVTMATTGNSTNFGDLPVARRGGFGTSNSRRAIFAGGYTPGSFKNTIDQVTIQSTGNATDFGDLVFAIQESSGSSDSHGGLE